MKRMIALFLLLVSVCILVYAENDQIARFRVNDRLLTEMSIEELYDLEDAVVSAMKLVFNADPIYRTSGEQVGVYVINPKTKKFHYPDCYSALQIGATRMFMYGAPSDLADQGYIPCGACKPHMNEE